MVAAGNAHGEVTIFQIQKELPSDLSSHEIAVSMIKAKPIERYTIKDACRGSITCAEWSKNGMKLFSGDSHGVVVLTEFDFIQHISKSTELINEKFGIIQMNFCSPWLLVSTIYRAIVCTKDASNQWKVSQMGRTDRKVLNDFGAVFTPIDVDHRKPPSIICARPGFRFWLADVDGNVSHTFLLKDSVHDIQSIFEVPLLNPVHGKLAHIKETYFGPCHYYLGKYIVTYCESTVFIINLEKLQAMATVRRLRKIQYLTVNGNEIFIVEGGRSIVRLSTVPESSAMAGGTQYVRSNSNLMSNESQIEIQEEIVAQADECFELPPIEHIRLDVPIACRLDSNLLKEDKLLLEYSRKLEVFEKINTLDYDESILFQSGTKKKKKTSHSSSLSDDAKLDGVVEIGRQAESLNVSEQMFFSANSGEGQRLNGVEHSQKDTTNLNLMTEFTTKPCLMEASFCDGINNVRDILPASHSVNGTNGNAKDTAINKISSENHTPHFKPLSYPVYPTTSNLSNGCQGKKADKSERFSIQSPLTEIPLTSDEEDDPDMIDSLAAIKQCASNRTPTNTPPKTVKPVIDSKNIKYLANIPKLWDIQIEKYDEHNGDATHNSNGNLSQEGSDSEWELL